MTPRDQEALDLWQANRRNPEIEALLDAFFNFPTSAEYEEQLSCVAEIFSAKPIFISDLPSHLSEAL